MERGVTLPADLPTFIPQPPAPVLKQGRAIGWSPLAFLSKDERTSTYLLQDRHGVNHNIAITPQGMAAWILDEPDETGKPVIAMFTLSTVEVKS